MEWGAEEWTADRYLLALLVELTDVLRHDFEVANSKKGTSVPKPVQIPRPKVRDEERPKASLGDLLRQLGG